jgi:multidrug efflux pump subunit AcrB
VQLPFQFNDVILARFDAALVSAIQQVEKELGKPLSLEMTFQGNAQAFGASLSSTPILIAAALFVIYLILGVLYESLVHPITIISTLPSAGLGALLLLMAVHYDLSVIAIVGIILSSASSRRTASCWWILPCKSSLTRA